MTEADLLGMLDADGVDLGPDAEAMLAEVLDEDTQLVMPLADGRWAWIPALLDGRTFTHRLSETEVAHDMMAVRPDLAPAAAMLTEIDTFQRLVDGTPIDVLPSFDGDVLAARGVSTTATGDEELLLLPPGHFAALGVTAGDLVGLRVTANGFELTRVAAPAPGDVGGALSDLVGERPDRPDTLDAAVWTVCADDDSAFRVPTEPLGDVLATSGLAYEGDWIAPREFDFGAWRVASRIETLKYRHQLDDDEALAVLATVRLYEQTLDLVDAMRNAQDGGDEDDLPEVIPQIAPKSGPTSPEDEREPDPDRTTVRMTLEFLADPVVAEAALAEIDSDDDNSAVALGVFAESAEPLAPRAARPALRWMRAKAYEALGDLEQAEMTLHDAEALDPSWPLTLLSLARYASDRGDVERGLALLRRAGVPGDDELVQQLERFRPAPRPDLGRNERCWCGSGRKYKVCHLNREQSPLEQRAAWLYHKAGADLLDGPFTPLLLATAEARAHYWDFPEALAVAIRDGLAVDAVLFEGGAFAEFLRVRGFLLPDDERSLAEHWLLVERSVHEVLNVSRGQGLTLRDVRTGDVREVRERAASSQVKVGELYCARVLPAGDTMQIFGGLEPVPLGERDDLIALLDDEPDPVDLVAALSRRFAPPVLQNTEGEPLMTCDATLRVDDPTTLTRLLDETYRRGEQHPDGTSDWFEFVTGDGTQWLRAHLELKDDELHVHANSTIRFERVLATVRTLDPSATVISDSREPVGDARAVQRLAAGSPATSAEFLDPTIAAALDEIVRKHEAAWLDEPIPALAGHTPRECADDPTRRPDLIRLLDSFPQDTGQPGTMSPTRLRAALGLD
jgi:tetratricopeptide (TPR) repeat protein